MNQLSLGLLVLANIYFVHGHPSVHIENIEDSNLEFNFDMNSDEDHPTNIHDQNTNPSLKSSTVILPDIHDQNTNPSLKSSTVSPPILRSCQDVPIQLQHRENGVYTIQPNATVRPFSVKCYFEDSVVITEVGHESEDETEVTCNTRRCHTEVIQYHASYPQMRALIELVGNCRQYVSYRCYNSILFRKGDDFSGWLSWNGERQLYWGGANGKPNSCACGLTGTCADPAYMCNCDKNDKRERSDSGYFTNEDLLPVHTLFFGDAGDSGEYGFFTLGRLQCMG